MTKNGEKRKEPEPANPEFRVKCQGHVWPRRLDDNEMPDCAYCEDKRGFMATGHNDAWWEDCPKCKRFRYVHCPKCGTRDGWIAVHFDEAVERMARLEHHPVNHFPDGYGYFNQSCADLRCPGYFKEYLPYYAKYLRAALGVEKEEG